MAKEDFGKPKSRLAAEVFLCPKCGGNLTRTMRNGTMGVSCYNKNVKLDSFEGSLLITNKFENTHNNFDGGCEVFENLSDARKRRFETSKKKKEKSND